MTSHRVYRNAVSPAEALAELRRCAGTQFDPRIVDAFCAVVGAERAGKAA
jgi:HD-GYP domain-containing protein (c-di-GMP phosphodiesterase class II)